MVSDVAQASLDVPCRYAFEIVALTARLYRRGHFVYLRRREYEHDAFWRLLERFQKRIERLRRQHVHLVDDVDLVFAVGRHELHRLSEAAYLVDAAVRRRIDFKYVHRRAVIHAQTALTLVARLRRRPLHAVQRLRENFRRARLARAARPREKIRVADAPRLYGLRQRAAHMLLADEVSKCRWPPFAVKRHIRHNMTPSYNSKFIFDYL